MVNDGFVRLSNYVSLNGSERHVWEIGSPMLLSLVISTIAFFVASYYIKRWADKNDTPKGMTRHIGIFVLAVALAYGVAWVVDKVAAFTSA